MTAINSNRAIRGPVTAVPVVAGKGVRLVADTENNRVVAEVDETVLWSGTASSSTIQLSESAENFERVKVLYKINDGICSSVEVIPNVSGVKVGMCIIAYYSSRIRMKGTCYTLQGTSLTPESNAAMASGPPSGTLSLATETGTFYVLQVVGVNRIASN